MRRCSTSLVIRRMEILNYTLIPFQTTWREFKSLEKILNLEMPRVFGNLVERPLLLIGIRIGSHTHHSVPAQTLCPAVTPGSSNRHQSIRERTFRAAL